MCNVFSITFHHPSRLQAYLPLACSFPKEEGRWMGVGRDGILRKWIRRLPIWEIHAAKWDSLPLPSSSPPPLSTTVTCFTGMSLPPFPPGFLVLLSWNTCHVEGDWAFPSASKVEMVRCVFSPFQGKSCQHLPNKMSLMMFSRNGGSLLSSSPLCIRSKDMSQKGKN